MKAKTIFKITGIIAVLAIAGFYFYIQALASVWVLNSPSKSPYFITIEPIVMNNLSLPKGTKIVYQERFFWQKHEQKKLLKEKNITALYFEESTMLWGGMPIISIEKFYNQKMKGYSVTADFDKWVSTKQTPFSILWQSCNDDMGVGVNNTSDWSFNKQNIVNIQSCGVSNQRYFKDDIDQQIFLDSLYVELMKIND